MTGPLVSIITITRNREKLIQRAINSVLRQTYSNIEYIIVDGASTDNTSRVVHSIPDDRIKFIELKENLPIAETINIGFRESHGEYILSLIHI